MEYMVPFVKKKISMVRGQVYTLDSSAMYSIKRLCKVKYQRDAAIAAEFNLSRV